MKKCMAVGRHTHVEVKMLKHSGLGTFLEVGMVRALLEKGVAKSAHACGAKHLPKSEYEYEYKYEYKYKYKHNY